MRTPSMTTIEAESILGPRGSLLVNKDTRSTVKKLLTAQGFKGTFVAALSMRELAFAYNMADGSGLDAIRRKYDEALADGVLDDDDNEIVAPPPPVTPPSSNDAVDLLRQMLLTGYKAGIDENQVRAIVQEQIAGVAPRVIEIKHDEKPPIKIDGLVHPEFERALHYLSKKGPNGYQTNVMLVGPAGCGKSHMISQLAKALDTDHTIVSGTAGATEGDLIGRLLPGDGGKFEYTPSQFVSLYERGNAVLGFDEIDGFDSNMLMIANMPLANGHMYVHLRKDNPQVERGENVYFVATANTFGTGANPIYVGRNPMDEATRDRFIFISVDYDKRLEESIAAAGGLTAAEMAGIWELRDRCREAQLRRVISTRAFQKASVMKQCGDSWREIRDRLLEGWSKDEKAKVGV